MPRAGTFLLALLLAGGVAGPLQAVESGVQVEGSAGSGATTSYEELQNLGRPNTALPVRPPAPVVEVVPVKPPTPTPPVPPVTPPVTPPVVAQQNPRPPVNPPVPPRQPVTSPAPAPVPVEALPPMPSGSPLPTGLPENSALPPMTGTSIGVGEMLPLIDMPTPLPENSAPPAVNATPVPTGELTGPGTTLARLLQRGEEFWRWLVLAAGLIVGVAGVAVAAVLAVRWWRSRSVRPPAANVDAARAVDDLLAATLAEEPVVRRARPAALNTVIPRLTPNSINMTVPVTRPAPPVQTKQETKMTPRLEPNDDLLEYETMKYREVYRLADQGSSVQEISTRTGFGEGEVGLVLDLAGLRQS